MGRFRLQSKVTTLRTISPTESPFEEAIPHLGSTKPLKIALGCDATNESK